MDQHTDSRLHSIISYLQRPQLIESFNFDSSAGRNAILNGKKNGYRIPDILLNPLYIDKLDGFTSFRATAVFKLQLNAQPFQCGRLLMFSVPMPTMTGLRTKWLSKHVTLAQSVHNVQLDIAKQTEVEIRIPFVSPFNSYDLIHGQYPWADLYIMVYSKLNQVQNPTLQCLVWGHLEDIQLGAPTSGKSSFKKAVQQSGRVGTDNAQPKAGTKPPLKPPQNLVEATRKVEGLGIISKIGGAAQTAYKQIGTAAPFLSPITDVLGTLSKIGTGLVGSLFSVLPGIGGLFGFSKPILHTSGNTVVVRPQQFFANANGNDHSHVLSLDVLNAIDEYPGLGGTVVSETSLDFISKIPQYICSFNYSISCNYNATLARMMVTPSYDVPATFQYQLDTNKVAPNQPTILKYISNPFVYWTGSLVYTIKFVKTDYHSGRVEISYHPFVSSVDQTRLDYVYRLVVDLREKSEVSFVVPYISPQPWKLTKADYDPFSNQLYWSVVGKNSTGVLYVRALTPLICSSPVVPSEIEALVEVRAGDDFRLHCPTRSDYIPFGFSDETTAVQQSGRVVAVPGQQETRTASIEGFIPPSITGSDVDIHRVDTQHLCAGEEFSDYLSLIKRFYWTNKFSLQANPRWVQLINFDNVIPAPELRLGMYKKVGDKETRTVNRFYLRRFISPLSYVSAMYAFYRGSYRLKFYSPDENVLYSAQLNYRNDINMYAGPLELVNYFGPEAIEQMNVKRFAEIQVPYYAPTVMTAHNKVFTSGDAFCTPQVSVLVSADVKSLEGEKESTVHMAVAAGDDFGLHSFIGVPPVMYLSYVFAKATADLDSPYLFDPKTIFVDPLFPVTYEDAVDIQWEKQPNDVSITPDDIAITDRVFSGQNYTQWCKMTTAAQTQTTPSWSYTYKSAAL